MPVQEVGSTKEAEDRINIVKKEDHPLPLVEEESRSPRYRPSGMYIVIVTFMFFCLVYSIITAFIPAPAGLLSQDCNCRGIDKCICARESIQAYTAFQLFCLANARASAYALYPLYLIMFLSMARNLRTRLQHTIVAEFVPLTSMHALHAWAGTILGVVVFWHALWHYIRWFVQGKATCLILFSQSGLTGLAALVITPILVWPMRLSKFRKAISFETRKRLHYLSWVWAVLLCFHSPLSCIFWIVGSAFLLYLVDWIYGLFVTTHLVASARFVTLESAIMIRVQKPEGFALKGSDGYCYLCVPWISKLEWHAFSAYTDPFDSDYVCFCVSVTGDWTKKLHEEVHHDDDDASHKPLYRRLWIYGPFVSPFAKATGHDHVISIASGIGITPALSVIRSLCDTRKMHFIWICRDAALLEFMLDYGAAFDDKGAYTFIFYTGKRELNFRRELPCNLFLRKGRPDLDKFISTLLMKTNTKNALDGLDTVASYDEEVYDNKDDGYSFSSSEMLEDMERGGASSLEHQFYREIKRLLLSYSVTELFSCVVRRSHHTTNNKGRRRVVCLEGLQNFMGDFFIQKFSEKQQKAVFDRLDSSKNGFLDLDAFQDFVQHMEENTEHDTKWQRRALERSHESVHSQLGIATTASSSDGNQESQEDSTVVHRPKRWRLMYCGGSTEITKVLQGISSRKQIPLSLESFEW